MLQIPDKNIDSQQRSPSDAPSSLPDVVARLEELATELEVQKALALNAVITDEAKLQEGKKKAQILHQGQDQRKSILSMQTSHESGYNLSDMQDILATSGIDISSLDPDTAAEASVALNIIAGLGEDNIDSSKSQTPAAGLTPIRGKGEEKLLASRRLLSTLQKQQLELEAMKAVIMNGNDYSNFPNLAAYGRKASQEESGRSSSPDFETDYQESALQDREPIGKSGGTKGRRVKRRGARLSTTGDLGVDADLVRTQARLDARKEAKRAFQEAAASFSSATTTTMELTVQEEGKTESGHVTDKLQFLQSSNGKGMTNGSMGQREFARTRGGPSQAPMSSVSQLTRRTFTPNSQQKNVVPASLRCIEEEAITRREAVLFERWKASGQLQQISSVKELLAQALSERDELMAKKRSLLATRVSTTTAATTNVANTTTDSGDANSPAPEVLDPLTGFAIHPESRKPMGILQITVIDARNIPPRRHSKEINSYVSLDLVLPESAKEHVKQTVIGQEFTGYSGNSGMKEAATKSEEQWARLVEEVASNDTTSGQSVRTSALQGTLYPEWRESFTLHPVTCAWLEVHIRVKDRHTGSLDSDDTILDAVLPLSMLTDQRKKRFRLSLGRPAGGQISSSSSSLSSHSRGANAVNAANLSSKVDPSCCLRVEARLCYSKVELLEGKIQDVDKRLVHLQSLLARLTVASGDSPGQSQTKSHTKCTTAASTTAGSKLYKSQQRLKRAQEARAKEQEEKAQERALLLEKKRQRAARASQLSKLALGLRERTPSTPSGGRSPSNGGAFADMPFSQVKERAQSEGPKSILKTAKVGSRLHSASTASSHKKKSHSVGASPLREEMRASRLASGAGIAKRANIDYAKQAGFGGKYANQSGSKYSSSGADPPKLAQNNARNASISAPGHALSAARMHKLRSSKLSVSRKGFGSTTPSSRAPGGIFSSTNSTRSKSAPSSSGRALESSSGSARTSSTADTELSSPHSSESYHTFFKREMGRKYTSVRKTDNSHTPPGFGSTIATGRSPTGSPVGRKSKYSTHNTNSPNDGMPGSDSVPTSPSQKGNEPPLSSLVGKQSSSSTSGATTEESSIIESSRVNGSVASGDSVAKVSAQTVNESVKTPFSTAIYKANRNWNSISGKRDNTPPAPAGVFDEAPIGLGMKYDKHQYNYSAGMKQIDMQRTDARLLSTGMLTPSAREELRAAQVGLRSQKLDEYLKSAHIQDMKSIDKEAQRYAAERSYRRTFRGAYMKVPEVSKRQQVREARLKRKASSSSHFGSVRDRFDTKTSMFK